MADEELDETIRQANLEDAITAGYDPETKRNDRYPAREEDEEAEWDFEDERGPVHLCQWNEGRDHALSERDLKDVDRGWVMETIRYECEFCQAWLLVTEHHVPEDFQEGGF